MTLCLAGMAAGAPVFAEGIYRWEDENGQVHYSDVPRKGAEEVEIEPVQTYSAPAIVSPATVGDSPDTASKSYQVFAIGSPKSEETFWNTGGKLDVSLDLQPDLRPGDQIHLYLDGQPQGVLSGGKTSMTLQEVWRGEHKVYAQIRDVTNRVLMETPQVTFFVQQQVVLEGNPIGKPAPPPPAVDPENPVPKSQVPVSRRKSVQRR